jgi:regulatory protein
MAWPSKSEGTPRPLRDEFLLKLSRREHSVYELRTHAKRKGYEPGETEAVLEDFIERGWVSDERFAEALTRHKLNISNWAPGRIVQLLRTRGISASLAEQVVKRIAPPDLGSSMEDSLRKKVSTYGKEPDFRKRKKKVVDYLMRRGYPPDVVFDSVDALMKRLFHDP